MGGFPLDSVRVPVIPLALPSDEMITINDRRWCIFPREAGWGKSYTSHGLPTLWRGSCEWWSNQLYQMAPYTLSDTLDRKISSRFTHPQSPRPGKDRQNPESFRVGKTRFWKKGPTVCINKRTLTIVEGKRAKPTEGTRNVLKAFEPPACHVGIWPSYQVYIQCVLEFKFFQFNASAL